jgi:hypothetical protein
VVEKIFTEDRLLSQHLIIDMTDSYTEGKLEPDELREICSFVGRPAASAWCIPKLPDERECLLNFAKSLFPDSGQADPFHQWLALVCVNL